MVKVECFPLGELQANCYFVTEGNDMSLLIDPGEPSSDVEKRVREFGEKKLRYILLTHGHFDHIGGAAHFKRLFPDAQIVISEKDSAFTRENRLNLSLFFMDSFDTFDADITVNDGDKLEFGRETISIMSTPGHTAGGVCYLLGDCIFTGDTVMSGTTGRMDFPTGSSRDMFRSVARIASIKEDLKMYCGHGEATTLGYEREHNIYMRKDRYDDLY